LRHLGSVDAPGHSSGALALSAAAVLATLRGGRLVHRLAVPAAQP
jgi:hypothetical protein